jgi:PAS domain S-box-containing protein
MNGSVIKILLLEDNPADAKLIQELLPATEMTQWQVVCVERLQEALQSTQAQAFDVILTDLSLPDAQGLDVVVQIHAQFPELPIVVLTVINDEAVGLDALRQGAQDYIPKSALSEHLLTRTIRHSLERARIHQVMWQQSMAMNACGEGIAILNAAYEYTYLNQAYAQIYGYENPTQLMGKSRLLLHDYQEIERMHQLVLPTLQAQGYWRGETVGVRQNGDYFDLDLSVTVLPNGGYVCTVRDISDRKQTEQALRRSESRFRQIFQNAPIGMALADVQTRQLVQVNPRWCEILGYTPLEMIYLTIDDISHPEDLPADILQTERLRHGDITMFQMEKRLVRRDGEIRWSKLAVTFLEDPTSGVRHTLGMIEDITEHKQAVDLLRQSEARFQKLVANIPGMIYRYILHPDHTEEFAYVSPRCCDLVELEAEAVQENPRLLWQLVYPEDVPAIRDAIAVSAHTLQPFDVEARITTPSGQMKWLRAIAQPERQANDHVVWDGIMMDISDRKHAEAEIYRSLAKQQELNTLKSHFVSMVSHEFRTPMTTIRTSTELLQHYYQQATPEKRQEYFNRIESAIGKMLTLMDNILLLGKAEAGGLRYEPAPMDLRQFCQDLISTLQLNASNHHRLVFTCETTTTQVVMDEVLLHHIFSNLLSNAIKYSPDGGTVELRLFQQDQYAIFQVKDTGIGIPPADQAHLFETFHRARNVGSIQGTGLGLAIVKNCIELHHGQITLESRVGTGTIFTVKLPLHP